ncbi:HD domain-containing protein [Anaerotignum lactatifermentans]|uniref:HD domain-containing protein n=1 Tax=Anaerotignum lactatifermentans TaxID=160404 RepID=A0ABS2G805_9FIRM|nr:HD domain-containing protein [Anaerotignum lactatifermentans]MBM6828820.1 HD domain-containing protein [Anaerotignum lactatifermentans]MBM6877007.1 HD domain-containing protein [Anaerotignum lactatifermentans]MBM6950565.1 HD domain-containing protein [Anaerotignum lactatifermentans]
MKDKERMIEELTERMMRFDQGDSKQIQHFLKVHRLAAIICEKEGIDEKTRFLTECAALVHDIGILPARKRYGCSSGRLQELEGPAYARKMLKEMGLAAEMVDRICYLVAHHHTYDQMQGIDYHILVEADFLVNFYEDEMDVSLREKMVADYFYTAAGRELYRWMYAPES